MKKNWNIVSEVLLVADEISNLYMSIVLQPGEY
jgi:hypothetical protein